MIRARLLDTEGQTVTELALDDPPNRPRMYVCTVAVVKIRWTPEPIEPYAPDFKRIEYRLERRDGGGTFIYRRVTPLW
jgi:hypothetical protein